MSAPNSNWQTIRASLSEVGWLPLLVLGVMGFSILLTYEIARPTVEALYQDVYGSENEPWAWLGVALLVTVVVGAYSRAVGRRTLNQMLPRILLLSALSLVGLLVMVEAGQEWAIYLLYLWKDIYIVVLVELFWSISNSVFPAHAAKWLYGVFSCIGGLGAFTGGRLAKALSGAEFGLEASLWVVAVFLVALATLCPWIPRTPDKKADAPSSQPSVFAGFRVVRSSAYLGSVLAIIVLTQLAITAIDYDFKMAVEVAFPDKFDRQGALADVYSTINVLALVLGFWGGAILSFLGLRNTLVSIPLVLAGCIVSFVLFPAYGVMMVTKIASKSMDYSLFRTAKELLYLPLSQAEKTEGKAVVDILTYRVAKGIASAILLGLKAVSAAPRAASIFSLLLVGVWLAVTFPLYRRYKQVAQERGVESL